MLSRPYLAEQIGAAGTFEQKASHAAPPEATTFEAVLGAMTHRLGYAVVAELQPIIDAIAASLGGRHLFPERDVSVSFPVPDGPTLVVSVRSHGALQQVPQQSSSRCLNARQLRLVIDTIHEKIAEPISVSMLSSVAGLSRSHFSHAFRTSVGLPPHAHVVRLRIERAMKLMLDTAVPLSEIALATGFADQAHFSNKFRRIAGMTPMQWRRTNRSRAEGGTPSPDAGHRPSRHTRVQAAFMT
jgi:AraC-like DNA-binding protein